MMKNSHSTVSLFGLMLALVLCVAHGQAQAYIDPGSGSIILQAILAAVFGALITLKLFWQKIKLSVLALFARKQSK